MVFVPFLFEFCIRLLTFLYGEPTRLETSGASQGYTTFSVTSITFTFEVRIRGKFHHHALAAQEISASGLQRKRSHRKEVNKI